MHHARPRPIHAMGAAIVERAGDAMREQSAGSGSGQVLVRPGFWVVWHPQVSSGLGAGVVRESITLRIHYAGTGRRRNLST